MAKSRGEKYWSERVADTVAAGCRAVDAGMAWHMRPKWCRGKLWPAMRRAAAGGKSIPRRRRVSEGARMTSSDIPGPHRSVPQNDQQRVSLQGRLLTGGSATLVVIRDPEFDEWVVYMEADPARAVRVSDREIEVASAKWHVWKAGGLT